MTVPWNIGHYKRLELRLHWGNKENNNYIVLNGKKLQKICTLYLQRKYICMWANIKGNIQSKVFLCAKKEGICKKIMKAKWL